MFGSLAKSLFGSGTNDRAVKRYASQVAAVNALEDETAALSDEQLHTSTADLRARLADQRQCVRARHPVANARRADDVGHGRGGERARVRR